MIDRFGWFDRDDLPDGWLGFGFAGLMLVASAVLWIWKSAQGPADRESGWLLKPYEPVRSVIDPGLPNYFGLTNLDFLAWLLVLLAGCVAYRTWTKHYGDGCDPLE